MLPEYDFSKSFHDMYRDYSENLKKKRDLKKEKKKCRKIKQKSKFELCFDTEFQSPPEIELPHNPSAFAVYASVRLAVLDRWMRLANQEYLQSSCAATTTTTSTTTIDHPQDADTDSDENSQTSSTYVPVKVSKIVGFGLRSVFELIKESRASHPILCSKALSALLDVLQGQSPEGLRTEPAEVIDPLFDLLLDLATSHGPESSVPNNGTHLTAIACSCLLSLVVVRGNTGKFLSATAALLMCPKALAVQNVKMPTVLTSLQRSIQSVLLGKVSKPDWLTCGVPKSSKIDCFQVIFPPEIFTSAFQLKSLASDGQYLYLFTNKGLFKIGSGYGGTIKGHVYHHKPDFYPNDRGTLVFCGENLYLKLIGRRGGEYLIVERQSLLICGSLPLHSRDSISSVIFSDGEYLGTISPTKDDGFVVRTLNPNSVPASLVNELPLKLAHRCIEILGTAPFEEDGALQVVNTGLDEEIASICIGKEFGLIRTTSGKVLYCGKASSLGVKQTGLRCSKWSELVLTKAPKVTHVVVGHDGLHAILLTEDGSVFFAGTARRGEDGDQNKIRRQPKPTKPKKMIKVDGYFVVSAACNSGSTALVTRDGELLIFGKDNAHADPTTGVVSNLKGEFIVQVALGKAHVVALNSKGQIYTFGINNKYQCGRDFGGINREGSLLNVTAMETGNASHDEQEVYEDLEEASLNHEEVENRPSCSDSNNADCPSREHMCPSGLHQWKHEMCMVCTVCRECTGYSISCLSAMRPERKPGQECGCGEGDSGCAVCGCCRICAHENIDNSELALLGPSGSADISGMMRLDVIFRDKVKELLPNRQKVKVHDSLRFDDRKGRTRKCLAGPSRQIMPKMKSSRSSSVLLPIPSTPVHRANPALAIARQNSLIGKDPMGSDVERDANRITSLPPAKIQLPCNSPITQIACGLHHTILLHQNGQVYSFGSNQFGQLGCGDILTKCSIQLVKLPCSAVQIAAGSNHSVVLTTKGEVYTFGSYQKGQLGRFPLPTSPQDVNQPGISSKYRDLKCPWYAIPTPIPNIGSRYGRRATWIGASGEQTFLKIDESLINSISLAKSTVTANKTSIILVPNQLENGTNFKCLVINKREGNCNSFKGKEQVEFTNKVVYLDPIYNVIWSFSSSNNEIMCYNIVATELSDKKVTETREQRILINAKTSLNIDQEIESETTDFNIISILSPELALPTISNCQVSRFQAALHLLCCMDTLCVAYDLNMSAVKEEVDSKSLVAEKQYSREDFQTVNRFDSHGGGWGYSGHSVEAIRFMADTDILLGGYGLFGGRGEYTAKIKLLDIGTDGGEHEGDGELLAETEEIPYECGPRQKYPIMFDEPISLQAQRWYVAWCRISGPSSDCGSSGQTMVTTEDQVLFYFKSSKKSNNGTDVNAGQIPQLLYKVITPETQSPCRQIDLIEPARLLSKEFSRSVSKECFQSLLSLLQWSWNTFKIGILDGHSSQYSYNVLELEKLVYISRASLRLIRSYINEIYPSQIMGKTHVENLSLAECIGDVRSFLKQVLSDNLPALLQSRKSNKIKTSKNGNTFVKMMNSIFDESHHTFVACFHAFYPTSYLKWNCLCDLLVNMNKEKDYYTTSKNQRMLSAVLCALCSPSIRLRNTLPLLTNIFSKSLENSSSLSNDFPHHYPVLVEQMTYKSQTESANIGSSWTWKDVLDQMLKLVGDPVSQSLLGHKVTSIQSLTKNCCHFLAKVVAELVYQTNSNEENLQNACGRVLHTTPSRFTKTNQSRTWNTGNGSPDAICFQVDRPGISVAGVAIYGGAGHYEYELELLEDQSSFTGLESQAHTQRWNSLETVRGSLGPEDFLSEIAEIKFDRPVPVKDNVKYAIRLRNHGGRTNNGDGGLNTVKGLDNTVFTFSTCSLSFNGTTVARGQIPSILYHSNLMENNKLSSTSLDQQARLEALNIASMVCQTSCKVLTLGREKADEIPSAEILSKSYVVKILLPLLFAHISPLITTDPRNAVHVLNLVHDMLPHVSALNLSTIPLSSSGKIILMDGNEGMQNTTSQYYTWVQSDHPYKPATVSNYRVVFPESVKWMILEFDPLCSTAQPEDTLQLYIPASENNSPSGLKATDLVDDSEEPFPYWSVLHKFTNCNQWPQSAVILPGHEVIFSLETASDYLKDERANFFGFKCLTVGYEWPYPGFNAPTFGLRQLEAELAFIGGMCTANLMKKELQLPSNSSEEISEIDIEMAEMVAAHTLSVHSSLLSRGFALNGIPSVSQALDGTLPFSFHSNERLFLRDFVNCTAGTSGGRLGQWLQPGSRVDPTKCQVIYSRDDFKYGWPAIVTLLTRDQYSDVVYVSNMKVEVKAIPIDKKEFGDGNCGRKMRRISQPDPMAFGGYPPPPLHHPYEPTVRDRMCFHSITVMKAYQNYSFEELRFTSPPVKRSSENMLVRGNNDGTYSATWTPASVGCYSIVVTIDGYEMEETYKVEVKEPPQGMTPPSQNLSKKPIHQPSKVRKFVAKNSAGLRIRAHPSLQSEQIGIVHVNGTIAFAEEIHNDDGVWLRLSPETIKQYCNITAIEAWCLQYNQHLGKTLLLPVEEPKTILDQVITDTILRKLPEVQDRRKASSSFEGAYQVVKCGASGHNVRSRPSLKAPPVGMLVLGNRVGVTQCLVNADGCWVLLDMATKEKYCFNTDSEAWSLAMGHNNSVYIGVLSDADKELNPQISAIGESMKKGYNFSPKTTPVPSDPQFNFIKPTVLPGTSGGSESTNPFVFGDESQSPKMPKRNKSKDSKISGVPKWIKEEDVQNDISERSLLDYKTNGNGITPPDTPKKRSPTPAPQSPKISSRSSSPVAIPGGSPHPSSPKSYGISPLVTGVSNAFLRRDSNQSDTSALVSSLTKDLSQSPSPLAQTKEFTSSPGESSPQKSLSETEQSPKVLTQTGTQTSPENAANTQIKGHFSIGSSAPKEEKVSPKFLRKDRVNIKIRPKRAISPATVQNQIPSNITYQPSGNVKQAMSPSVAESLRAVFAAFLWHEGIVHDAMACASFLKFHPGLPKQGALVVTRHGQTDHAVDKRKQELSKEERARQRHSVEVSAGTYLHIQPSTLETLTRSAANANANRSRGRKITEGVIKEESEGNYGHQTVAVLPPALKSLVYLWDELTSNCLSTLTKQKSAMSPTKPRVRKIGRLLVRPDEKTLLLMEKESKKMRKKKTVQKSISGFDEAGHSSNAGGAMNNDKEAYCDICKENFAHPITFHMRQSHPGCGQTAGGKGYNSSGNFCLGWAGNCGEGGVPGSSWYLLCENCRDTHMKTYRSNKLKSFTNIGVGQMEPHIVMKNNAMFLLDLASSANSAMSHQRRPSGGTMPSLSENNSPPDISDPFGPLPPFQCLQTLGATEIHKEPIIYDDDRQRRNIQDGFQSPNGKRPLSEVSLVENEADGSRGQRFHRSVSMGTNGVPWSKAGLDGRIIMLRKRNSTNIEQLNEGGSSLLCNPSPALQKLVPKMESSTAITKNQSNDSLNSQEQFGKLLIERPVMSFILEHHDLDSLQLAMKQALRKAMCRVYAMQALNWLLRSVTQPVCLHDLLWWFVTSLTPLEIDNDANDDNKSHKRVEDQDTNVCEHPLSDITIAGEAVHPLPSTFHALLQTVADLMVLLPMGSALQQMAVKCWGIRFSQNDHSFLHRSQVFSNISKILSRSEEMEDCTVSMQENHQNLCYVECLKDITSSVEIKASSRQAMVGSLTDGSTETFWESGDEDRNKTKCLMISCPQNLHPKLVCVHIDNCRDLANKISNIIFYSGINSNDLVKQRASEVENRLLGGWINCPILDDRHTVLRIELKGSDNSVRIRQIRVLGEVVGESLKIGKQLNASTIQQKNCEGETLRVFRLITSQVFGKLITGDKNDGPANLDSGSASISDLLEPLEESNELREHMVGILFSRSKLTHLQKLVIVHIVQAIRKESVRVREEWEQILSSSGFGSCSSGQSFDAAKNSDTYCFEMLSMVLALSGSSVGRAYLSHQGGFLGDLLSLLHTGSARVQRQVTALLRRMLPEITPDFFAKIIGVHHLPVKDFGIITTSSRGCNEDTFNVHRVGILDIFLSIIAKALTVQVKMKGKSGDGGPAKEITTITLATSLQSKENVDKRWWMRGTSSRKHAEVIVGLLKEMSSGKLSELWANVTKGAIAENILNLTQLSEEQRVPTTCIHTPTLWLALASLCVLDKEHVERLSSGQWRKASGQPAPPRPTCTNHDDGETNAVVQCNSCGNLCADCDRFLHLHRKTRVHLRQVCKEEEEAIKVELHEGCGRTKLYWLLAVADARTLKALIEFREGGSKPKGTATSGVCRFCGTIGNSGLLAIGNVCADHECQEYGKTACTKLLGCGHLCGGVLGESTCLPCLHGCSSNSTLKQDADDMCMICFTEALSYAPAIQLNCGHVFHLHCCRATLLKRWPGPRITFSFSLCPICKENIDHPKLADLLAPIQELFKDVKRKALMRLEYEGLHTVEAITTPGTRYYEDPASYAMDRYAYYVCYKCNKAYYGGEARCDAEVGENYDPAELVCGGCSDVTRAQMCHKHGTDFLEYKCRYCCSVAVFFCFGTTHFCNPCHDDFQRVTNLPKHELPSCPAGPKAKQLEGDECPLHVNHPPTGEEFALGCGVCRNAHTF